MFLPKFFSTFMNSDPQKNDFSGFFRETPIEEQKKILEKVVRKANQDQKKIVEEYRKLNQKATP